MPLNSINLTLRAATDADFAFLWDLHEIAMRDQVEVSSVWDHAAQMELFRARFTARQWRIIVAKDGADVGAYAVKRSQAMSILTDIYLLPQHQRQGIGSFVLSALIEEASRTKRPLVLLVLKDNTKARRLYERLGMRLVGERGDQFIMTT
jgi:ribosomal protein S18 acetylase RimI-like enzyme